MNHQLQTLAEHKSYKIMQIFFWQKRSMRKVVSIIYFHHLELFTTTDWELSWEFTF